MSIHLSDVAAALEFVLHDSDPYVVNLWVREETVEDPRRGRCDAVRWSWSRLPRTASISLIGWA